MGFLFRKARSDIQRLHERKQVERGAVMMAGRFWPGNSKPTSDRRKVDGAPGGLASAVKTATLNLKNLGGGG